MTPNGNLTFILEDMQNAKGETMAVAPGSGHTVYLPIPEDIDVSFGILMRNLEGGENTRQPFTKPAEQPAG
jgi:putative protease